MVPGGVASLIEDELDSIIIDSASNIVLLVVPVDDGLSAVNRRALETISAYCLVLLNTLPLTVAELVASVKALTRTYSSLA